MRPLIFKPLRNFLVRIRQVGLGVIITTFGLLVAFIVDRKSCQEPAPALTSLRRRQFAGDTSHELPYDGMASTRIG